MHPTDACTFYLTFPSLSLSHSLSLLFNGHYSGGPGLAGTRMSPFLILLELRMVEVVSVDNRST